MKLEIRQKIEQMSQGKLPPGYKKIKNGIAPISWSRTQMEALFNRLMRKNVKGIQNVLTISAQKGLIKQEAFFTKSIASEDKSNYFLLKKGEFAYNKSYSNGYPYGTIKRMEDYNEGIVSPLYICFSANKNNQCPDFFLQYFEAGKLNQEIGACAQEGARNHGLLNISVKDFFHMSLIVPPIEEQQKIAEILMTQDRVIALKERYLEEKRRQKKYLMQVLLTGKKRLPGFSGAWKAVQFRDIFTFGSTNSFARQYMSSQGKGVKNIHYGDILIKYDEIVDAGKDFIPVLLSTVNLRQNEFLSDGDIVIADTAEDLTAGKVIEIQNVGTQKIVAGMHTMLCKPKKNLFAPRWLGFYMNSSYYHTQLVPYIAGIKVMSISKGNIVKTHILAPTIKEQQAIVEVLSAADREISLLRRELGEERQKKKALMQLLLSGIVRTI